MLNNKDTMTRNVNIRKHLVEKYGNRSILLILGHHRVKVSQITHSGGKPFLYSQLTILDWDIVRFYVAFLERLGKLPL